MIFPWQQSQWDLLQKQKAEKRLPHALLLSGVPGLGKNSFALEFIQSVFCQQPHSEGKACQKCRHCQLFQANNHPDFKIIAPEEVGKPIKIDQIRSLSDFIHQSPQLGSYKVILITECEMMNENASNAFLKNLEEPSGQALIILTSSKMMSLLATIRSRCQKILFTVPEREKALAWLLSENRDAAVSLSKTPTKDPEKLNLILNLAQGAPLQAFDFIKDDELSFRKTLFEQFQSILIDSPIPVAEQWSKEDLSRILLHLKSWVADIVKLQSKVDVCKLTNPDLIDALTQIALQKNPQELFYFWDELNKISEMISNQLNPNKQLLLENLLIHWTRISKS